MLDGIVNPFSIIAAISKLFDVELFAHKKNRIKYRELRERDTPNNAGNMAHIVAELRRRQTCSARTGQCESFCLLHTEQRIEQI